MTYMTTEYRPSTELPARERILVTAHDLFYRDGIRATGIDRVIAQSKVTKVTFYRHYPSKNDLIRAYLNYRHDKWMGWLRTTLERHVSSGRPPLDALLATFDEWWHSPDYRGCAFINATAELATADPEVLELVKKHKAEMTNVFETLLPRGAGRLAKARALTLTIDGAIVHAQMGTPVRLLLETLKLIAEPLLNTRS
jgi:AcrR family transcriptional regulator